MVCSTSGIIRRETTVNQHSLIPQVVPSWPIDRYLSLAGSLKLLLQQDKIWRPQRLRPLWFDCQELRHRRPSLQAQDSNRRQVPGLYRYANPGRLFSKRTSRYAIAHFPVHGNALPGTKSAPPGTFLSTSRYSLIRKQDVQEVQENKMSSRMLSL